MQHKSNLVSNGFALQLKIHITQPWKLFLGQIWNTCIFSRNIYGLPFSLSSLMPKLKYNKSPCKFIIISSVDFNSTFKQQ